MINKIGIRNFKALGPQKYDFGIRPLTIFVGPNGTGKSSVLQAIGLLAQTISSKDKYQFLLDGDLVSFPADSYESLFYKKDQKEWMEFEIALDGKSVPDLRVLFERYRTKKIPNGIRLPGRFSVSYSVSWRVRKFDDWRHEFKVNNETNHLSQRIHPDAGHTESTYRIKGIEDSQIAQIQNTDGHVLFGKYFMADYKAGQYDPQEKITIDSTWTEIIRSFGGSFSRIKSLTPLRGTELMERELKDAGPGIGKYGQKLPSFLMSLGTQNEKDVERMRAYLKKFGIEDLAVGHVGRLKIGLNYKDPYTDAILEIDHAASGSKNALILVTALTRLEPGSVFLLEEPEISMHPGYEKTLAEVFVEEVKRGQQIITSTHSEVLTWAVCNQVRLGKILPSEVAIWEMKRDKEGLHPVLLEISDKGNLKEGWISSFAEIERSLLCEWEEGTNRKENKVKNRRRKTIKK
jgi:energy-coupling factor transporter ATP-binding protein EcfA2